MKKVILLLMAIFVLSVLFSCGDETPKTPDESSNETVSGDVAETEGENKEEQPKRLSEEEKAKYHKVIEYDLPEGDFRDVVVDYMKKQAELKWVCSKDFGISEQFSHWGISLEYKKGETYYGLVYSDYKVSYQQFEDLLVNGTYTNESSDWKTVPGVGCYMSILNSIQQFENTDGYTDIFMPGHADFLLNTVGDYKLPDTIRRTQDICEANGADAMYEAFLQLKKGDIIFTKDYYEKGNSVHCRVVVEEPTIHKNGLGKLVPSRCSIKTIEQTNKFDETRTDGVKTTWYIDHTYSFTDLYNTYYVPVTLKSYEMSKSEMELPYILLDKEVTSEVLAKGAFSSSVKSNFPIRFVNVDILDKDGKVVSTGIKGDLHSTYNVALRNSFLTVFDGLEKGVEYTFVLTAGISRGSAELARVDFTHSK